MKCLIVYGNGGARKQALPKRASKGFEALGCDVITEELYCLLDIEWFSFSRNIAYKWFFRLMGVSEEMGAFTKFCLRHCSRSLLSFLRENPVAFILTDDGKASSVISLILRGKGISTPVFHFSPNPGSFPKAFPFAAIDKVFVTSSYAKEKADAMKGSEIASVIPVPIDIPSESKDEVRSHLGIDGKRTFFVFADDDGKGAEKLIDVLSKSGRDANVFIYGKDKEILDKRYSSAKKSVSIKTLTSADDWLSCLKASDASVGKWDIWNILSSFGCETPYILTEKAKQEESVKTLSSVGVLLDAAENRKEALRKVGQGEEIFTGPQFGKLGLMFGTEAFCEGILKSLSQK